jgi:hypothetical protein
MAWTTPTWGSRTDGDILTAAQVNDLRDSLRALAGTDATGPTMLVVNGQASAPANPAGNDLRLYALTADNRLRARTAGGVVYDVGANEGSYTPALSGTTGSAGAYAASVQTGRWFRQGRWVWFQSRIVLTSKGSWTGDLRLSLPFTSSSDADSFTPINVAQWANLAVSAVSVTANPLNGSTLANVRINTGATASSRQGVLADISDTTQLIFGGFFLAA